jgi:hypothetical protein
MQFCERCQRVRTKRMEGRGWVSLSRQAFASASLATAAA